MSLIPDPPLHDRTGFDSATLLLVEDSEDDVFLMKRAFRKAGLVNPISVAADGDQAVAYLEGRGPYADRARFPLPILILLDLNLPKKDGQETLAWIRRTPSVRALPVYVLSASVRDADVAQALEAGANAFLVKPSTVEELVDMARSLRDLARFQAFPRVSAAS